jgi:hypothetical protein
MSDLDKLTPPRGDARSMSSLSATNVDVAYGRQTDGANWFGPLQPTVPIATPEVGGRALDYPTGVNLQQRPRQDEEVSYQTLRAIADSLDILRIIIERRKDQMARLQWTIRVKHDGASTKRPKLAQLSSSARFRIREIEDFIRRPSYEWPFKDWLRALVEDILVTDAPALYCERNGRGDLIGLRPIDGTTVRRIVSEDGTMPRPSAWDGRTFEWLGGQVTPANFYALGFRVRGDLVYPPCYVRVLKGASAANLTALDLIYRPLNRRTHKLYGMSPTETVVNTVNMALRRAQSQGDYFTEGNQPDAIYSLPETWTPDQTQRFQDYWDNLFSGHLGNRRRMKFVGGGKYTPLKEPPLKAEIDEWLARIICAAFSFAPTPFVQLANRSLAESHDRATEREGVLPLQTWLAEVINDVIADEFGEGEIEFAWSDEDEIDQEKQATILNSYAENGVFSINTVREKLGEEPDPDPAANRLMVKTATGYVPIGAASAPSKEETAQ